MTAAQQEFPEAPAPGALRVFFGPLVQARTYTAALYLLLGLPLAVGAFCVLVALLATGFALAVTVVGLPIVWLALRVAGGLTAADLAVAGALLDTPLPRVPAMSRRGKGLRGYLGDRAAWASVGYLMVRLPVSLACFIAGVSVVASGLYFVSLPILERVGVELVMGSYHIDSQAEAWLFVPGGVLLLLVSPHVIKGLAALCSGLSRLLVGRVSYQRLRGDVLALLGPESGGALTGPAVLDQLRLYNGESADFTSRKVYAVLTELERSGRVRRAPAEPFDRYWLAPA